MFDVLREMLYDEIQSAPRHFDENIDYLAAVVAAHLIHCVLNHFLFQENRNNIIHVIINLLLYFYLTSSILSVNNYRLYFFALLLLQIGLIIPACSWKVRRRAQRLNGEGFQNTPILRTSLVVRWPWTHSWWTLRRWQIACHLYVNKRRALLIKFFYSVKGYRYKDRNGFVTVQVLCARRFCQNFVYFT